MSHTPATLLELLEPVAGERTALILADDGTRVTYASLREQIQEVADTFAGLGIGRGDRVAMALPNGLPAIVCFLGAALAGTAAPLNPSYREDEFRFFLEDTDARLLVVPKEGADEARRAAGEKVPIVTVTVEGGRVQLSASKSRKTASAPTPDDLALVLHTSGSTGRPKRVPLKQSNLANSIANIIATYDLTPDDVSLCVMPLFHVHGLMASLMATLASGGTVVVPSRFNPLGFWRIVRDSSARAARHWRPRPCIRWKKRLAFRCSRPTV